ncbi:MAG: GtrA family protein [Neisseriaceae bacterium]|nr:GtrA family protein [Neisseriaceae bacterium]
MMIERILSFQAARFIIVGIAATLTDLGVSSLLLKIFGWHETLCAAIGFAVAFWVSYFGHRFFTFRTFGNPFKFFLLAVSMLALREVMIFGLTMMNIRGFVALFIPLCVVTLITFVISKYGIFKE